MKKLIIHSLLLLLVTGIIACNESTVSVYRFSQPEFNRVMNDSIIALVETPGDNFRLRGNIELEQGSCHVVILNPISDTIFSKIYLAIGKFKINEQIDRVTGEWRFYYRLERLDGLDPKGSLELQLTFNN